MNRLFDTRPLLLLLAVASLAGCNSDVPPPLTGNLTDARGAHAGTFRGPGNDTSDGNAAADAGDNSQGNTQ